jgi:SET domain-containing protein
MDSVKIADSKIPGAGKGIIATKRIPANTDLGEYIGQWVPITSIDVDNYDFKYAWAISDYRGNKRPAGVKLKDDSVIGYIDAKDATKSSYHRYINHPMTDEEANVHGKQIKNKLYYYTIKDIEPGDELYINYGSEYGNQLREKK